MARHQRFIWRASIIAQEGTCNFLIGAVVARGSCLVSTGHCEKKTHPKNPKNNTLKTQLCAEFLAGVRALRVLPRNKIKECTLYVARKKRDGTLGMAKPCIYCQSFLREIGIKNICYTTQTGNIKYMEI